MDIKIKTKKQKGIDTALFKEIFGYEQTEVETPIARAYKALHEAYFRDKPLKGKSDFHSYREAAEAILKEAINDTKHGADVLDVIKECASNRWSNGYSDSLLDAVLCNLTSLDDDKAERDDRGEIILRPKTDWNLELL